MVGEVEDENAWAAGGIEGHAGLSVLLQGSSSVLRLCKLLKIKKTKS
ncbi:MAG: hypothetical protein R2874_15915 [Desulfobacterales bacterium]